MLFALLLSFDLSFDAEYPAPVTALSLAALAVGGFLLAELIGYRPAPAGAGDPKDVQHASVQKFRAGMMLRLGLTEAPVVVGLTLSFVLDHGMWPFVIVGAPGLLSMVVHGWPGERSISRYERALERDGQRSYLRRGLGLAA